MARHETRPSFKTFFGTMVILAAAFALWAGASPALAGESLRDAELGYSAYIPSLKDAQAKSPVLVTLPAYGIKADQDVDLWAFTAEKSGLTTVSVDMDYDRLGRPGDVERRIETILEALAGRAPSIDRGRVLIAGTNSGGMLAIALGLKYPEKYAAVAVAGGASLRWADWGSLTNARKQSFFLLHGGQNKHLPLHEWNKTLQQLRAHGGRVKSEVYPDSDHILPAHAYSQLIADLRSAVDPA